MDNQKKTDRTTPEQSGIAATGTDWQSQYDSLKADRLPDNVVDLIGKQWMLVTAGTPDSFNTMTASWGAIGYIWNRPATFIFIRDSRYTYGFLQREERFTLSFFDEKYRAALNVCGTQSGRDTDKVAEAGLTPLETPSGLMSFREARMIVECRKMFVQELDYANLAEPYKEQIMKASYTKEPSKHREFISEITHIWVRK